MKSSLGTERLLLFLSLTLVLALRFWALGEKPPHHDEAINGWFVTQMWQQGYFNYDPTNYHGPLLFYLFQWMEPFLGSSVEALRSVTSFFSLLTVGLFAFVGICKKRPAFLFGAFVLTLSPAAEFFGRSAIHESPFVFFMALTLFAFLFLDLLVPLLVIGVLGMLLLKETWVIWALSALFAAVLDRVWREKSFQKFFREQKSKGFRWVLSAGLVLALFYSGFLQDLSGIVDFFAAFLPWTKTGVAGAGHNKPIEHWLFLIANNEVPTLLCLLLSGAGCFFKSTQVRFFSRLSLIHFAIYSFIPYKTPWCLLSMQLPLIFSGVLVLEELLRSAAKAVVRWGIVSVLAIACFCHWSLLRSITWQSPIDMTHPYVYVQTHYDVKLLMQHLQRAEVLLSQHKIQVATAESWPFPWLFRKYPLLSFAKGDSEPDPQAALLLYDLPQAERVRSRLKDSHWERVLPVRQSREPAVLFLRRDLLQMVGAF